MSACKLGTEPVNRLTREQCDKMLRKWYYRCHKDVWMGIYTETNYYLSVKYRIQQYKDNLDKRGL